MYKSSLIKVFTFLSVVLMSALVYAEVNASEDQPPGFILNDVKVRQERNGISIALALGTITPYYVTMLDNPDRIVIDLHNVRPTKGMKERKFDRLPVERMRIGRHPDFLRLVFDLAKDVRFTDFVSQFENGRIIISFLKKTEEQYIIEPVVNAAVEKEKVPKVPVGSDVVSQPPKETIVQPVAEAIKVEKSDATDSKKVPAVKGSETEGPAVAKSIADPAAENVIINSVSIKQYDGFSRLVLSLSREGVEHKIVRESEREIVLGLSGCSVSPDVPGIIDKVERSGPISMIQISKEKKDINTCLITISMREKVPHHLVKDGKSLNWDFYYIDKPKEIKYSEEMVAGEEKDEVPEKADDLGSKKTYKGKRISMDFKDANIHNILRLISDVAKINIITSDDVKGTVTVTLRNVPWDQALEIILKTKGLGMKRVGNIIRVAPLEVFQKEAEVEMAKKKALDALEPLKVRLIPVNYGYAKDIVAQVKDVLSDRGTINIDERTNVIIIKDKVENIIKAEGLIRSLDTQTPQVLIEARIVEANTSFVRDIGIQWGGNMVFAPQYGNPTGLTFPNVVGISGGADDARTMNQLSGVQNPAGFAVNMPSPVGAGAGGAIGFILGNASGSANLNLRLSALENTGHVKILSAPRVTTLDNKEAKIASGVSIPISQVSAAGVMTVFVDAKLELAVTPHVTQDGSIMLKIVTTKNEPDFSRTGAQGDPTILKKEAFTQVLVKDGDTTVIGGIYTRRQAEELAKVPLLSNIPVLGWLFKKKKSSDERTELLIFITPRIVNRAEAIVQQRG